VARVPPDRKKELALPDAPEPNWSAKAESIPIVACVVELKVPQGVLSVGAQALHRDELVQGAPASVPSGHQSVDLSPCQPLRLLEKGKNPHELVPGCVVPTPTSMSQIDECKPPKRMIVLVRPKTHEFAGPLLDRPRYLGGASRTQLWTLMHHVGTRQPC
jgi:hypothetical protein